MILKGSWFKDLNIEIWTHMFLLHASLKRPNFELIQALMYVLITWKYDEDPIKTVKKSGNTVFPIISIWGFFWR